MVADVVGVVVVAVAEVLVDRVVVVAVVVGCGCVVYRRSRTAPSAVPPPGFDPVFPSW